MKPPEECKDMNDIRREIDRIDAGIVALIAERSTYVGAAAKFKKDEAAVRDPARVENVISSKIDLAERSGVSPVLIEKIYRLMIDFFIGEEMDEAARLRNKKK
jgi:isochorismate pyruvate lyase